MAQAKRPALPAASASSIHKGDALATPATRTPRKQYKPLSVVKFSGWVEPGLLARAKNAVAALSAPPPHGEGLTLTALLNAALAVEVRKLEKKHHRGRPFAPMVGSLTRGARPKRLPAR